MDALSWFALGVIIFVVLALVYGIVALHDIPYEIAKARHHPHQDAIFAGGWISLFTLHAIWPLLWVWAMAYDPDSGYAGRERSGDAPEEKADDVAALKRRIADLEGQLAGTKSKVPSAQKEA